MKNLKRIIFDADDTLWDNNKFYVNASNAFFNICEQAGYDKEEAINNFDELELKIVKERGYGSKHYIYILESLFNYYNNLNHNKLNKNEFDKLLSDFTSHTHNKPLIFPGVHETLEKLQQRYDLFILTKGNIKEQNRKVKNSGLSKYFKDIFVVPEKDDATYLSIFKQHKWNSRESCMVGNSPKSDINPALRLGMYAIFIPYPHTWKLDNEAIMAGNKNLFEVKNFQSVTDVLNNSKNSR